jgi:hypothetical protein
MPVKISALDRLGCLESRLMPPGLDYAIVESAAEIRFVDLSAVNVTEFLGFPRGLAFGSECEIRWIKRISGIHVVAIDDRGWILPGARFQAELEPAGEAALPRFIVLLGRREGAEFLDGRIPRPLAYPFAPRFLSAERLGVSLRHYVFPATALPVSRCASIVEIPDCGGIQ